MLAPLPPYLGPSLRITHQTTALKNREEKKHTICFSIPLKSIFPKQHNAVKSPPATMSFPESHNNSHDMTPTDNADWGRQQSGGRKTVSFVQNDIQQVVAQSPFLQQASAADTSSSIALFHRSEIVTGKRLGKGGFSDVYEITALELNHDFVSSRLTQQQCKLRRQYQRAIASSSEHRYAIKQLQEELLNNPKQFHVAASDLAVEAAYMSSLDHVNILQARGLPVDGVEALADGRHDGYFIILDRLQGTLDQRIEEWKTQQDQLDAASSNVSLLLEKVDYALQLARAVAYLHERRIIFRDIKLANVGFTADGTIKLIDFGLCRQLPPTPCTAGGSFCEKVYEMSGVGTRRYMAVEVINNNTNSPASNNPRYNEKADVYSWSMLFWEMLSLQKPFQTYTIEEHRVLVCQNGHRPQLHNMQIPMSIQHLLQQTWCESIPQRLSMQQAHNVLENILDSSFCTAVGPRQQQQLLPAPVSPVGACDSNFMMTMMLEQELYNDKQQMLILPMMPHLQLPYVSTTTTTTSDHDEQDEHADGFLEDHRMSSEEGGQEGATDICSLLLDDDSLLGAGNADDSNDMLLLADCPNVPYRPQQEHTQQHYLHTDAYVYYPDYAMEQYASNTPQCCSSDAYYRSGNFLQF
jgi:serine/threonine protein kinase